MIIRLASSQAQDRESSPPTGEEGSAGFRALQHLQLQGAAKVEGAAMNLKHCTGEEFALSCCQQRVDLWTINYTKTVFGRGPPRNRWGAHEVP